MSKRILIVEDEKNLARFVSLELQHEGYDVVTADNGREGLEMALEKDFDLILLDLMLPEMDVFEVTRRLQQEKDTYIMMMTARDSIMDIVAGLDRGADDYIVKPFILPNLLASPSAIITSLPLTHFGSKRNRIRSTLLSGTTSCSLILSICFSLLSAVLMFFSLFHCLC